MKLTRCYFLLLTLFFSGLMSCSIFRKPYVPEKKYDTLSLKHDFDLFRRILEQKHPALYWYTSKETMDSLFENHRNNIKDSLTDQDFLWHFLAPIAHHVRCGHTTIRKSRKRERWENKIRPKSFPLILKLWNDTLGVARTLAPTDTIFKRGMIIKKIDGHSDTEMIETMKNVLSLDGYADNVNVVRISNNFPLLHRYLYGIREKYEVEYIDLFGNIKTDSLSVFDPGKKDSLKKKDLTSSKTKKQREKRPLEKYRKFEIDSTGSYATISLNTFSNGRLRRFFRKSFTEIEKRKIEHVIIDLRSNGGGKVSNSTLLTKYVTRKPFTVADSVYSTTRTLRPFWKHTHLAFLNEVFFYLLSYKKRDNLHHISRLEHKKYHPKKKNNYTDNLYILTHGPTFSASTLFCNVMKGQNKVTIVGEETGGGWYGNSGIIIPDFVLPKTKLRLRMPLFKVVQSNHSIDKLGKGIPPDVYVGYNKDALLNGKDLKMEKVKELIEQQVKQKPIE